MSYRGCTLPESSSGFLEEPVPLRVRVFQPPRSGSKPLPKPVAPRGEVKSTGLAFSVAVRATEKSDGEER